jgi:4'-phosphopantetheinyl transferase
MAPGNEIHVWLTQDRDVDDPALLRRYEHMLSDEERGRLNRFHFAVHRHQYLIAHALVRCTLSRYRPDVEPHEWQFEPLAYGKPAISAPVADAPSFNLSHADGLVALAVADPGMQLGVDVECLSRKSDVLDIAPRYFADWEVRELRDLPQEQRLRQFFTLWTLKEAYIKACGMGLSIPLNAFGFVFDEGNTAIRFAPARKDVPDAWRFWRFAPDENHLVALAIREPDVCRKFVPRLFLGSPLGQWQAGNALQCAGVDHQPLAETLA